MIIEIRVSNCFSFLDPIVFSMKADMRSKKFSSNVYKENNFNILKVAGIYGPNNAGKTCLVRCIREIKNILLNKELSLKKNLFTKNKVCELGVTFLESGRKFSYDLKYNTEKNEYLYEKFVEISKDKHGNEKEVTWLLKDSESINNNYVCDNEDLVKMLPIISQNGLVCYLIDASKFKCLSEMKKIIINFASKIDILDMNNIPIQKTIDFMKNKNSLQQKVVNFIKNADLYMDDFEYVEMKQIKVSDNDNEKPAENVLNLPNKIMDQIRLVSVYKGIPVPSILFDSTGTKKVAALASYIIEALEKGRILVVDELDSSIHFKITRAIVAMFNNELNLNSQLIFTIHDINLLDCKKMFRKEQIWFVHKDKDGVYVYSLAEFTAENGVRETTDIMEKYRKGALGALPDPELIKSLLDIKENRKGDIKDE